MITSVLKLTWISGHWKKSVHLSRVPTSSSNQYAKFVIELPPVTSQIQHCCSQCSGALCTCLAPQLKNLNFALTTFNFAENLPHCCISCACVNICKCQYLMFLYCSRVLVTSNLLHVHRMALTCTGSKLNNGTSSCILHVRLSTRVQVQALCHYT